MSLQFKLTIVKVEAHPKAGQPIPSTHYNSNMTYPDTLETRAVEAMIKEEELDCIKQALLKVWK